MQLDRLAPVISQYPTSGALTINSAGLLGVPGVPLTSSPINGLTVDIYSSQASNAIVAGTELRGPTVEAHLYGSDLVANYDFLESIYAADDAACTGGLGSCWLNGTNASVLPRSAVLPYPPNPYWNTALRYAVSPLPSSAFFPASAPPATPGQFDPAPSDADPAGLGSVKSARIYVPGLCSTERMFHTSDWKGVFDAVEIGIWNAFGTNNQVNAASVNYLYATTLLDDGLMFVGTANTPRGGFLLDFWLQGQHITANGQPGEPTNFAANYSFYFGLADGFVSITPQRNCSQGTETDCLLVEPQLFYDDFRSALEGDLPSKFEEDSQSAQTQVIPGVACANGSVGAIPSAIANIARIAAQQYLGAGADATTIQTTVVGGINWTCVNGQVAVVLRAKRVNVYEDRLELVWFDGEEPTNFAYGLYAAMVWINHNPGAVIPGTGVVPPAGLDQLLCSRPRAHVGPGDPTSLGGNPPYLTRPITTVSFPQVANHNP